MNDIAVPAQVGTSRFESFAAELTSAVYPLLLRRAPAHWLDLELSLWNELTATTQRCVRDKPPEVADDAFQEWREALVVALTETAFSIAVDNGIKGSLLDLGLLLFQAVRVVTWSARRAREREAVDG